MPTLPVTVPPIDIDVDTCAWDRVRRLADRLAVEQAIYLRGGIVVQPPRLDAEARLDMRPHTVDTIATYASQWVQYYRDTVDKKGDVHRKAVPIPRPDLAALLALSDLPERVPHIDHVYGCPVLLPDGGVMTGTGYDHGTRSWRTIGDIATEEMAVEEARDVLWELVDQVPFVGGRTSASFGAVVAAMLTPLVAHVAPGPAPMLVIDANVQGTGKSRLAQVILRSVFGRAWPPSPLPTGTETSEKRLTTLALSGTPAVLIDNVRGVVRSTELEAALTSEVHSDRILGTNRQAVIRWTPLWIMTSNNARLNSDMVDRIMLCRLHSDHESPRSVGGWRVQDIAAHIEAQRGRIVSALVCILRAGYTAGWPSPPLGAWGSFEVWSRHVLSALHVAGITDPRTDREQWVGEVDVDREELSSILDAWPAGDAYSASEIEDALRQGGKDSPLPPALVDALREALHQHTARSIGHQLSRYQGRRLGGRELRCVRTRSARKWQVVRPHDQNESEEPPF
jgi:hypothetical protein